MYMPFVYYCLLIQLFMRQPQRLSSLMIEKTFSMKQLLRSAIIWKKSELKVVDLRLIRAVLLTFITKQRRT